MNHWLQLLILLRNSSNAAACFLRSPGHVTAPSEATLSKIVSLAGQAYLQEEVEIPLLSGVLLASTTQRKAWAAVGCDDAVLQNLITRYLPGPAPESLLDCFWIHAPILTVQGQAVQCIQMLLTLNGQDQKNVCLGHPRPEQSIRDTLTQGFRLGSREWQGFMYWFLQPENDQPVSGDSLGLTAALAARFLFQSRPWPRGLYATGAVDMSGTLLPVVHTRDKIRSVAYDCRLFLLPQGNYLPALTDFSEITSYCCDVDDACRSVEMFVQEVPANTMHLYQSCLYSVTELLSHFHALPFFVLNSPQCQQLLLSSGSRSGQYLDKLCKALQQCSYDPERGKLLAAILNPEKILTLIRQHPQLVFSGFNWCLACINLYNHIGRIERSEQWTSLAEHLISRVDAQELNRFLNKEFVATRFNRYDFRPDLPPALCALLEQEENKQEIISGRNYLLGALYGTLAQNYGFCGPDWLDSLLEMCEKAAPCFGNKHYLNRNRLKNYQIYALIDSKRAEDALALVNPYLLLSPGAGPDQWFQHVLQLLMEKEVNREHSFQAALVLRVLSFIGYALPLADSLLNIHFCSHHPWQLIALNLGKIHYAGNRENEAVRLFHHCLRICLAGGSTMRAMGLLPLAEMHYLGCAGKQEYEQADTIRKHLVHTNGLHSDHFSIITDITAAEELLDIVRQQRSVLFPFSYR